MSMIPGTWQVLFHDKYSTIQDEAIHTFAMASQMQIFLKATRFKEKACVKTNACMQITTSQALF